MGPTWAQHGANMGSKKAPRSVQGGSNCSPEGVTSSDCSPTAHMDPTWTPNAPQMNPKLGSCWDHLGVVLGSSWDHLGVILGSLWGHCGTVLVPTFFAKMSRNRFWLQNQDLGPSPGAKYSEFGALPVPTGPGRVKGAGGRGRSP